MRMKEAFLDANGHWYGESPFEDDECDCAKCQSIREPDECDNWCAKCQSLRAEDGPQSDAYYNAENSGETSFQQDMRDAGRGHLV